MPLTKREKPSLGVIVTGLVSIFTVLINSYISFLNNQDTLQSEQLANLQDQVYFLSEERESCMNNTFSLKNELLSCYASQTIEQNRRALLETFIDNLPIIAWIKKVEDVDGVLTFPMATINKAYEDKYNVSRHRYIGNTDDHMWPEPIANGFRESDLKVWNRKQAIKVVEKVPKEAMESTAEVEENTVIKWIINIGDEFWIAGLLLEE